MNFGWGPESYAVPYGSPDVESAYTSMPLGTSNGNSRYAMQSSIAAMNWRLTTSNSFSFADAMSAFTNQDPADYKHDLGSTTVDPMTMSPEPYQSMSPSTASRHDSAQASSATSKTSPNEASVTPQTTPNDTPEIPDDDDDCEEEEEEQNPPPLPFESETTTRARYAANQRHAKTRNAQQQASNNTASSSSHTSIATTQATAKKAALREKNKVAAAKCRQRQRKQAETIRAKGSRLSETNAQLKSYVQELRGELNGLRALALGHGDCDDQLARYNQVQAERVMRDYYSACGGLAGSMISSSRQGEQSRSQ
jgi:hypothetical protein